jgi:ATP-binding cassette subfamily B protein
MSDGLASDDVRSPARILRYSVRRAPGWIVLVVPAMVTGTAVELLLPAALAHVVDAAVAGAPTGRDLLWVGVLFGLGAAGGVVSAWASSAGNATVAMALRQGLADRILVAGVPGRRRFAAGDLTSRMVAGASGASSLTPMVLSTLNSVVLSLGGLVALTLIDWPLAVAFLLCVPVSAVLIRRFVSRLSELMTRYQELQGTLSALLVEALSGARTIRAGGTMARETERLLGPLPELNAIGRERWAEQRRTVWKLSLLTPLTEVVVLAVAGVEVSSGRISPGSWIAVAGYVLIALGLLNLTDPLLSLAQVRAGTGRLVDVLDLPAGPGGSRPVPEGPGAIAFRSVSVHEDGETVLDRLDLEIPAGMLVAIVGRSGAGKSTLAALAGGLAAPGTGEVLLDGARVAELRPDELRRAVTYAFERPALLGETVHDAIAYGTDGTSRAQVERAAAHASADGFVRRLPDGYDTRLAQAPFSGGERQRLGLARAVVGEPRVLILDDATSSLDTATEAEVTRTLTHLLAGRTRIVVAHRIGTATHADLVVWLEDGRVRAMAPHERLWDEPDYRAMFAEEPA